MADALLNGGDGGDDGDIFVYTGGEQEVPDDVRRVRIAENVDTILARAFQDCHQLIEVEGHDRIKKIEKDAFLRCRRLRRLTKMTGVIEIERWAFGGCNDLSDVEFDKLEIIGSLAFDYCNSLRSINMTSVRSVGWSAFQFCSALTDAVFGKDLESIDEAAFNKCTSLRSIAIPLKDGLIIDDNAFFDYVDAFQGCDNLVRVDVIGGSYESFSSLHLESWKNGMKEEIDRINQTLPVRAGAINRWIESVLRRMEHYKVEHKVLMKEAMTLLELALWKANLHENDIDLEGVRVTRGQVKRARKERCITSGAGIIIKNVLPFLELDE
jgi:hypothetical protein